jgi:Uma2 family endonuclease
MQKVDDAVGTGITRRRFTVEEYHRMGEAGILHEDDRIELIEGDIIQMPPIGGGHVGGVNRLTAVFTGRLGSRVVVSVQNPVRLSSGSEPEPDLALLRPKADFYASGVPQASDVLLLIEVADSSLAFDRDVKVPLYAAAGIPEVWLLDLANGRLRVFRDPEGGEYRHTAILARGEAVTPQAFPDLTLTIAELLG